MLAEREFFIRKAIGWVLREISRHDPAWIAAPAGATGRIQGQIRPSTAAALGGLTCGFMGRA
jgi:hypothetical protein